MEFWVFCPQGGLHSTRSAHVGWGTPESEGEKDHGPGISRIDRLVFKADVKDEWENWFLPFLVCLLFTGCVPLDLMILEVFSNLNDSDSIKLFSLREGDFLGKSQDCTYKFNLFSFLKEGKNTEKT